MRLVGCCLLLGACASTSGAPPLAATPPATTTSSASAQAPSSTAAVEPPAAAARAASSPPRSDPAAASPATASAEPGPAPPVPAATRVKFSEHYRKEEAFRLLEWKREHHATGPTFDQECWDLGVTVGTPAEAGLLCVTENRSPEFKLARIYRLEGQALRVVWEATVATYANWLDLTPLLDAEGGLVLSEGFPGSCEMAAGQAEGMGRNRPPSTQLIRPACTKVGKYRYENRRYRLVERAPSQRYPVGSY